MRPAPVVAPDTIVRLGEVLTFMKLLWAVDHGLQSTSKRMEARLGVTGPQRLVIRIVGRFPGISAGELAVILQLHPSTLTGILRRLQERGIVERRHDPNDGRRALFALTARGRELDALRVGTVEATVRQLLKALPRRKLKAAQEVLGALAEALQTSTEDHRLAPTARGVPDRAGRGATRKKDSVRLLRNVCP